MGFTITDDFLIETIGISFNNVYCTLRGQANISKIAKNNYSITGTLWYYTKKDEYETLQELKRTHVGISSTTPDLSFEDLYTACKDLVEFDGLTLVDDV